MGILVLSRHSIFYINWALTKPSSKSLTLLVQKFIRLAVVMVTTLHVLHILEALEVSVIFMKSKIDTVAPV